MDNVNNASKYATADDFNRWTERAKTMTDAELDYGMRDAAKTATLLDKHDPVLAGRYMDEAATYAQEIMNRRAR